MKALATMAPIALIFFGLAAKAHLVDLGNSGYMLHLNRFADLETLIKENKAKASKITAIKFERLNRNDLSAEQLNALLRAFPHAKTLTFWSTIDVDVGGIKEDLLNQIANIGVVMGTFPVENLKVLARSKNLKTFSHGNSLGVEGENELEVLRGHPTLESLSVEGAYSDKVFDLLFTMPKLRTVDIMIGPSSRISKERARAFYHEKVKRMPGFALNIERTSGEIIFSSEDEHF